MYLKHFHTITKDKTFCNYCKESLDLLGKNGLACECNKFIYLFVTVTVVKIVHIFYILNVLKNYKIIFQIHVKFI